MLCNDSLYTRNLVVLVDSVDVCLLDTSLNRKYIQLDYLSTPHSATL
jgi:hypothetical protein